ncbi:MAG: complex I subunit 1/NuoH family protein [Planctomycetota bacterium]
MDTTGWIIYAAKYILAFIPLTLLPLLVFLERKGAAVIQDRPGPNRASLNLSFVPKPLRKLRAFGLLYNVTDGIKLLFKEDFIPARAHKWFYILAPCIPVATVLVTPGLIPWFAPFEYGDYTVFGSVISSDSSLLLLFALGALAVYGVVLGSWGSNSKFSLLGGMRSSAMMVSYEVSMGLGVLGLVLIVGSFGMTDIGLWQEHNTWGAVVQPIGFLLFMVSMFAETGRTPFDVAEGESEIVGGFHTEYSSFKFAMFFMGEYAHVGIASALMAVLFCGAWDLFPWAEGFLGLPGGGTEFVRANLGYVIAALLVVKFLLFALLRTVVGRQRERYASFQASDQERKQAEYGFFHTVFSLAAVGCLAAAVAAALLISPEPLLDQHGLVMHDDVGFTRYAAWVNIVTALVQLGVVVAKTLFFGWLFIWVRWTLPRLRYDQIMSLGWKVLLNIALVNLVLTAIITKLVTGGN